MRRPNLFIVGAPKCGTTALHNYLSEHPECFMCRIKEPGYFSRESASSESKRVHPFMNSLEAYLKLFQEATERHKIIGESSTSYLRDEKALVELKAFSEDLRIIALIRDPVLLVSSYFHYLRFQGFEPLTTLQEAWDIQHERCAGRLLSQHIPRPDSLAYRNVAMLGRQVSNLFRIFPENRILIVLSNDLKDNPNDIGRTIQEFLRITYVPHKEIKQQNEARTARSRFLDNLVKRSPPSVNRVKDNVKRLLGIHSLGIRALLDKINSVPEPHSVPPELEREMREFFYEDVQLLGRTINRDLIAAWKWK